MAAGNVGNYKGALNAATTLTGEAAQPITGADVAQYFNPYMDTVIGGLRKASNENLFNDVLPGIQDRFVSAGQSRSPQEAHLTNEAVYKSGQALDQSIAGALGQGYQGALNTALQQQGVKQAAGAQFGQLGALTQQLGAGDVGQVAAGGQSQDLINQANVNAALNNFYSQQQWPYQNLGFASNIIRGLPINTNQQTVGLTTPQQAYTSSPLANFVGTTLGAASLGGYGSRGYRRGGAVQPGALSYLAKAA